MMTTLEALKKINKMTPLSVHDNDDIVPVKCICVNGDCLPGESQCNKCYSGWKGRMCDIPDNRNKDVRRPEDSRM